MSTKLTALAALMCVVTSTSGLAQQKDQRDSGLPEFGSLKLLDAISYVRTGNRLLTGARVVGGRVAQPGTHPWQVALIAAEGTNVLDAFFCGGSLYKADWVVTAAHCVDRRTDPAQVDVVVGSQDLRAPGIRVKVRAIHVHSAYSSRTMDNDIALLQLMMPISDPRAKLISLVATTEEPRLVYDKAPLMTSGWGATRQGGDVVPELRELIVPYVPTAVCNDRVSYNGKITDNMICAGQQTGGQDACQGDSGGPLSAGADAARRLVGIVSWGYGCANPDKYGVYTRVARYTKWISDVVQ